MKKHAKKQAFFMEFYESHGDAIFRYALSKTSDRERALDITQETFMKFWEYVSKDQEFKSPKALIYQIARNQIIDWYRKKKSSSLDELMETKDFSVDVPLVEFSEARIIFEKIDEFEEPIRTTLLLRFNEDRSIKEIAKTLGESENTVSVRIHRALEELRKLLS